MVLLQAMPCAKHRFRATLLIGSSVSPRFTHSMIYVFLKKHKTVLVGKQQMVFPFVHSTNIPQDSYYVPSTMMGAEKSRANT